MTLYTPTLTAVIGFWLNLDAELELENPQGYRQSPRVAARIDALRPRLGSLLGAEGRVIAHQTLPPGSPALAWCPTPSALWQIEQHGLKAASHPAFEVLRRVNHRAFCASLGQTLEGATQVGDMATLRERVRRPTATGDWVLKRPFGFAGRERRRAIQGVLDESTEGFARTSFARNEPLQVEPWVRRELDVAIHGWLERDGTTHLATPVLQHCDAMGRFERAGSEASAQLEARFVAELRDEAERVARALHGAGYFGPFGLDAYRYRDHDGSTRFNPRSEINARFTMAYQWPEGTGPAWAAAR